MKRFKFQFLFIALLAFLVIFPAMAFSQVAGKITKVAGNVDILRTGATAVIPAKVNDSLSIGDILRTKSDGSAEITFIDNSVMAVGPKSRLGIEEYLYKPDENKRVVSVKLQRGRTSFNVPRPVYAAEGSKFEMKTRTAIAGVRGTQGILFSGTVERVYIKEGAVEFSNPLGKVTVTAGRVGEAVYGQPPTQRPYSEKEFKKQEEGVKPSKSSDKKSEGEAKQGEKTAAKSDSGAPQAKADSTASSGDAISAQAGAAAASAVPSAGSSALTTAAQSAGVPPPSIATPTNRNVLTVTEATGAVSTSTGVRIKINHQ